MTDQTILIRIEEIVGKLQEEFSDSKYEIYHDENLDFEESLQISLSDCSTPQSYEDEMLDLSDKLLETLSFHFSANNVVNQPALIKHIIERINKRWTVWYFPDKIIELYGDKDFKELNSKQELFERIKFKVQNAVISNLKALLNDRQPLILRKLKWQGQQKQLAELFAHLIEKGWIHNPAYIDKNDPTGTTPESQNYLPELLNEIFDMRETTKKGSFDKTKNLTRYLQYDPNSKYHYECINSNGVFFHLPTRPKVIDS